MATKTFEELKQLAIQIRDEKTNKQNTATRIGTQMLEHLDKLEQDYYDKTATDEELKERDEKLTELENNNISRCTYLKNKDLVGNTFNFSKFGYYRKEDGYIFSKGEQRWGIEWLVIFIPVQVGLTYNVSNFGGADGLREACMVDVNLNYNHSITTSENQITAIKNDSYLAIQYGAIVTCNTTYVADYIPLKNYNNVFVLQNNILAKCTYINGENLINNTFNFSRFGYYNDNNFILGEQSWGIEWTVIHIPVKVGLTYNVSNFGGADGNRKAYMLDKNLIPTHSITTIENQITSQENDAYLAVSYGSVVTTNTTYYIDYNPLMTNNIAVDFAHLTKLSENPVEIISQSAGMTSIIHDWGFIGDSLASGEMQCYDGTEQNFIDMYEYSWGQRLCALCGSTGYNFSQGGQTTLGWILGDTERTWGGAKSNIKQAYIIALGTNDRVQSYPVGDAETDIDTSDYNNNAETFAGYYGGIIQRIKSVQPKAVIFVATLANEGNDSSIPYNEQIRKMPNIFDNVFLIDRWVYCPKYTGDFRKNYYMNGHLNPAGYQWEAYMFATYIDWIIRKNYDKFIDCALIGTNYTASPQN